MLDENRHATFLERITLLFSTMLRTLCMVAIASVCYAGKYLPICDANALTDKKAVVVYTFIAALAALTALVQSKASDWTPSNWGYEIADGIVSAVLLLVFLHGMTVAPDTDLVWFVKWVFGVMLAATIGFDWIGRLARRHYLGKGMDPHCNMWIEPKAGAPVGTKAVLHWVSSGASSAEISGIGTVALTGMHEVEPPSGTTTYALTVKNDAGKSHTTNVTVTRL